MFILKKLLCLCKNLSSQFFFLHDLQISNSYFCMKLRIVVMFLADWRACWVWTSIWAPSAHSRIIQSRLVLHCIWGGWIFISGFYSPFDCWRRESIWESPNGEELTLIRMHLEAFSPTHHICRLMALCQFCMPSTQTAVPYCDICLLSLKCIWYERAGLHSKHAKDFTP